MNPELIAELTKMALAWHQQIDVDPSDPYDEGYNHAKHECYEGLTVLLRTHSAEIAGDLRDAERWQTIESAPRDGGKVLLYHAGYKSAFYQRDHEPRVWVDVFRQGNWYNTAPSAPPTHWRPLPAPPTMDSAMQQGGGGGE